MTRRQAIIEQLKLETLSVEDLTMLFRTHAENILEDLRHIDKSVQPQAKLLMTPAECRGCGYVFKERTKSKTPSRCPKCKSDWITAPRFTIR